MPSTREEVDLGIDRYHAVIGRFTTACQADARIVAAFLGGSLAAGNVDEYSDLDLYLIVEDEAYEAFFAERRTFMHQLGNPVLLEDFDGFGFDMVLFIFDDGVEGELGLARASRFAHMHGGPFKTLVDKQGILARQVFPPYKPTETEQRETLRWLVYWFWRDLSKFSTVMARGWLWSAYGYVETLRLTCVNLARLKHDFTSPPEGYAKMERAVDIEDLAGLQATTCSVDRDAILAAVRSLIGFYLQVAPPLAAKHGIAYPANLQSVVARQLERACGISYLGRQNRS